MAQPSPIPIVIARLDRAIHFAADMDHRVKPGGDDEQGAEVQTPS
jgi:hypothetical protein